ncbi:MAG: mechanosensitive ion channel family protein [Sulfobacillus acidophilus]|uniref:Mechanosensitive ion channel family protein n=1 Tax=Sulfobacillus acidophilus TaxID=53633 RepID=A0A2T2WFH4_9FIRM|nr:MAG: mechanosensitive ion channel family protein [Sulfobacillus acidophilus]
MIRYGQEVFTVSLQPKRPAITWKIITVIAIGIGLQVVLNHLPPDLQKHYGDLFRAAIVLLAGGAISYLVEHWLKRLEANRIGARRATSVRFMARLVLYLAIALAVLAAFGVGLSSVVFGSAFVTVILGLAGQNFFANLIAGIGLVIFHPFDVGDRISFVTWQYTMMMASYPHEATKPAYGGIVRDINLAYTTLETDEGISMLVPNGILIQASIENHHDQQQRPYRFRFDMDLRLNPDHLLDRINDRLHTLPYPVHARLADLSPTSFSILLYGETRGLTPDAVKHDLLRHLIPITQELDATTKTPKLDSH